MKMLSVLFIVLSIAMSCGSSNSDPLGEVIDTTLVNDEGLELAKVQLPEGFKIDVFARVSNARSLAISPDGTVFVGRAQSHPAGGCRGVLWGRYHSGNYQLVGPANARFLTDGG